MVPSAPDDPPDDPDTVEEEVGAIQRAIWALEGLLIKVFSTDKPTHVGAVRQSNDANERDRIQQLACGHSAIG